MVHQDFLRSIWETRYCIQRQPLWLICCDEKVRASVYHTGSLSSLLATTYKGDITVRHLRSKLTRPTLEERTIIGSPKKPCRVREVELSVQGVVRILARTVVQAHPVCLPLSQAIIHDYTHPIGSLLYSDPLTRSTMIGYKVFIQPEYRGISRRRLISYREWRLCVTEFFVSL